MAHPLLRKKNLTFNMFMAAIKAPSESARFVRLADAFLKGDHWYKGLGYIGPIPTDTNGKDAQDIIQKIHKTFVSRNVTKETMRRGVTGLLGNEPAWMVTDKTLEQRVKDNRGRQTEIEERKEAILAKILAFIESQTEDEEGVPQPAPGNPDSPEDGGAGGANPTPKPDDVPESGEEGEKKKKETGLLGTAEEEPINETLVLAETLLKDNWLNTNAMEEFKKAVAKRLVRGYGLLRLYIPAKYFNTQDGTLKEDLDLVEAMNAIKVEFCDKGRVLDHQGDKLSIIEHQHKDVTTVSGMTNKSTRLEICFVDDDDQTWVAEVVQNKKRSSQIQNQLGKLKDDQGTEDADQTNKIGKNLMRIAELSTPMDLGGNLTSYEISGEPYCTQQLLDNNKLLNLNLTMSGNTTIEAGFSELVLTNVELEREDPEDIDSPVKGIKRGGGVVNNFQSVIIDDKDDGEKAIPAGVHFKDPAPVSTFTEGKNMAYRNCLEEVSQLYVITTGDSTTTAVSRIQAREEFILRMHDFKPEIDRMGSWLFTTVLRLASVLAGEEDKFKGLSVQFECRLSAGKLTPEERRQIQTEVKDGTRTKESARMLLGIFDSATEQDKIDIEKYEDLFQQVVTQVITNKMTLSSPQPTEETGGN